MVGVRNDSVVPRTRVSICNVLQMPNHLCLQPHSLQIRLKPAVNLILMVRHLSLSHALHQPPHPTPLSAFSPRSLSAFPNAVTKQSFSLPCIIFVSREAHGSIRPSWEIQIVTGVMWTGSLHMPPLVPPCSAQSSANRRLRIYLYDFHSALCHLFTLSSWSKRVG